jgi:predicted metalloprotease with PDZ domain
MKTITSRLLAILVLISTTNAKAENLFWNSLNENDTHRVSTQDATASDSNNNTINYEVTIDKSNPKRAAVNLSFIPQNSVLYMAPGANQLPKRWATFVHNLKAVDAKGQAIAIEELSDAHWKMQSPPNEKITVSYELWLDHAAHSWSGGLDGVAYTTDWGVFYTGRALLLFNGDEWKNIKVDFNLSSDWQVTTPWNALADTKNSFVVDNYTALRQSMFFAGTQEEVSLKRGDFELVMALGGDDIIAQKKELSTMAEGVMDYYIALMGGIPNPSPDNKFTKSIVIINSSTMTDGEVIGNNISMLIEKDGNQMSQMISRFMFAHEFFHLWNGKSFWPTTDETEWFKEGFSNYYTLKSLRHVGFLDDDSYLQILNNLFFQRYSGDDGVGKLSMTQGEEKHAHWGLIYGGGLFVAISQDMIIRNATQNKKSMDDIMKGFFQKYGGTTADGYTLDELRESLSIASGTDQSEFFDTYIIGTQRIPIHTYLSMAGLDTQIEDGQLKIAKKKEATALEEQMNQGLFGILNTND